MIVGGVLGALGLAVLVVAHGRAVRLAALGAVVVGGALLFVTLRPEGNDALLAVTAVVGVAAAVGLAALFLRWPWLLPMAALACAPARVPVKVGGEEASLLLPLYAVVIAGVLALAWELFRGNGRARELGPLAWPLAAFIAWAGVSLLWSDGARQGAVSLAAFYLPFGLLALMLARLPWQRRWLKALALQLIAMAVVFAGIGIYQWLTRDVFWNPKVIIGNVYAPFYRVNSLFWDPSIYGRFLVVAILVALVAVLYGDRRDSIAAAVTVVALWIGLVFSFSQSSFVALVAGVLGAIALFVGATRGGCARARGPRSARRRLRGAVRARGDPRQHRPCDGEPLDARDGRPAHRRRPPSRGRRARRVQERVRRAGRLPCGGPGAGGVAQHAGHRRGGTRRPGPAPVRLACRDRALAPVPPCLAELRGPRFALLRARAARDPRPLALLQRVLRGPDELEPARPERARLRLAKQHARESGPLERQVEAEREEHERVGGDEHDRDLEAVDESFPTTVSAPAVTQRPWRRGATGTAPGRAAARRRPCTTNMNA